MPIILEKVPAVASLLREAAVRHGTVPYTQLYATFGMRVSEGDLHATLEAAGSMLADPGDAIYVAVLSVGLTGLPGDAFYPAYRARRRTEYLEIAPDDPNPSVLTLEQRRRMAEHERSRVYAHAERSLVVGARQKLKTDGEAATV